MEMKQIINLNNILTTLIYMLIYINFIIIFGLIVILIIMITYGEPDLIDQVINTVKNYPETIKCK